MIEVKFYEEVKDEKLKYTVIVTRYNGKWVFCRHKDRKTLEIPGGHREKGERIIDTAKRELYEETGAINYTIEPISVYSVINKDENEETFGFLYLAEVKEFEKELYNEIEEIVLLDDFPNNCTYSHTTKTF